MANPLYNILNGANRNFQRPQNNMMNLISQFRQVQQNPGAILDIMLQNGKITQQEYQEMQPYKNNPQQLVQYLTKGHASEINQAQQQANNLNI